MSKTLTEQEIREEIERLSPFFHDIELPYGLRTYVPELSRRDSERKRLARLLRHFWPTLLSVYGGSLRGQRVLDLACNCGGLSVEAAKAGAEYVLGIDIVDRYLEQAEFVKQKYNW
jgi:tRNA (mo5U34)-methyltransferase